MFLFFSSSFMAYCDLTSQVIAFFSNVQIILQQSMGYFSQQIDYQYCYIVELTSIIKGKKLLTDFVSPVHKIRI
jgi:hypothetical protein